MQHARSGTLGRRRKASRCSMRPSGSSPRPPPDRRAPALQGAIPAPSSSRSNAISPSPAFSRSLPGFPASKGPGWPHRPTGRRRAGRSVSQPSCQGRENVSRSSPRSGRSTASRLLCRHIRMPRPGPAALAAVVGPVVTVHLCRGQHPLVGCLTQFRGAGPGTRCHGQRRLAHGGQPPHNHASE